jgi:hypothetical protein
MKSTYSNVYLFTKVRIYIEAFLWPVLWVKFIKKMLPAIPQLAVPLAREEYGLRGHRLIGDRAVKHLE